MAAGVQTPMIKDLGQWIEAFLAPTVLIELGSLIVCVLLAWLLVSGLRRGLGQADGRSIFFGQRVVDGALFPLVLLVGRLLLCPRKLCSSYTYFHLIENFPGFPNI